MKIKKRYCATADFITTPALEKVLIEELGLEREVRMAQRVNLPFGGVMITVEVRTLRKGAMLTAFHIRYNQILNDAKKINRGTDKR